jgi:hypothetical protein
VFWRGAVGLVRSSKQVPLKMWNAYNNPCAMKGNAPLLASGQGFVLGWGFDARDFKKKGSDTA